MKTPQIISDYRPIKETPVLQICANFNAPGLNHPVSDTTTLVTFNQTVCLGSQGPKGAIGPLKKVASLRETARAVNQKIAQTLPNVCQKLTKSLPKYKKQQTQWLSLIHI